MANTFKSLPQNKNVQDEVFQMVVNPDYTGQVAVGPNQKITATRKTGTKETYYPTTTGGKLDKFSAKLPGGPKIQASAGTGTGTGMDPDSIMRRRLEALKAHYKNKQSVLKGYKLSPKQHNSIVKNMQNEYDEQKFGMIAARLQVEDIKRGVAAGDIEQGAGEEAMLRLILPKEHVNALFPKEGKERTPLSPPALKGHLEKQEEFAEAAPSTGQFFTGQANEPRTQEDLVRQYIHWREQFGYDNFTPGQQRQLDIQWDNLMFDRPKYEWKPDSPEIKSLRTYGNRLSRAIGPKISPFAKSVKTAKPKTTFGATVRGAFATQIPGAEFIYNKLAGQKKEPQGGLPTPRTEAEYNALPSGTEYIGTDGQRKTKS